MLDYNGEVDALDQAASLLCLIQVKYSFKSSGSPSISLPFQESERIWMEKSIIAHFCQTGDFITVAKKLKTLIFIKSLFQNCGNNVT